MTSFSFTPIFFILPTFAKFLNDVGPILNNTLYQAQSLHNEHLLDPLPPKRFHQLRMRERDKDNATYPGGGNRDLRLTTLWIQ